jgi:hypothetical protein
MSRFKVSTWSCIVLMTGSSTMGWRGPERIALDSTPAGADVRIECDAIVIGSGVAPTSVMVPRAAGNCLVVISHEGYEPRRVVLEKGFNRLYWGNFPTMAGVPLGLFAIALSNGTYGAANVAVALGALGGAGLIIDSVTGAKYDHDPKKVTVTLQARH